MAKKLEKSNTLLPVGGLTAHFVTPTQVNKSSTLEVAPLNGKPLSDLQEYVVPLSEERCCGGSVYPPVDNRAVMSGVAKGYMEIIPRAGIKPFQLLTQPREESYVPAAAEEESVGFGLGERNPNTLMTREEYMQYVEGLKTKENQFVAMTAYGAVPIPESLLQNIPEQLQASPIEEEEEVFVTKETRVVRTTEKDFTHFDHRFLDFPLDVELEKIHPIQETQYIEIPKFTYKPIVEEKIIEVPQGVKYVEVPIELPCAYPPKIIPVPKEMIIERIIETTKPVVQEKIVEVPRIEKVAVPRAVKRQIPYVVPKYIEKIIEIPYRYGQELPPQQGAQMAYIPKPPPLKQDFNAHAVVADAQVVDDVLYFPDTTDTKPQEVYIAAGIREIKLPYEAKIDITVIEEKEVPAGVPIAQPKLRYMMPQAMDQEVVPDGRIYAGSMDQIVEHEPPGLGQVSCKQQAFTQDQLEIMTQQGVMKMKDMKSITNDILMPPLPGNPQIPLTYDGQPDREIIKGSAEQYHVRLNDDIVHIPSKRCGPCN